MPFRIVPAIEWKHGHRCESHRLRGPIFRPDTAVIRNFKHPLDRLIKVFEIRLDRLAGQGNDAGIVPIVDAPWIEQRDRLSGTVHAQYGILVVTNDLAANGRTGGREAHFVTSSERGCQRDETRSTGNRLKGRGGLARNLVQNHVRVAAGNVRVHIHSTAPTGRSDPTAFVHFHIGLFGQGHPQHIAGTGGTGAQAVILASLAGSMVFLSDKGRPGLARWSKS